MKKRSIVHVHAMQFSRSLVSRFIIDSLSTLRPFARHFHVNDRNLRLSIGRYIFISRITDAISSWKNTRESNGLSLNHRSHYGMRMFYNHLKEISAFFLFFFFFRYSIIQMRSKVTIFRLVAKETVQTRNLNLNLQFSLFLPLFRFILSYSLYL